MSLPSLSQLERELTVQLQEAASGEARPVSATVVVVATGDQAAAADAALDRLLGRRPIRLIHIQIDLPVATFRARVSARCAPRSNRGGICFEDIYLQSTDKVAADPRLWSPLVFRELPSLLYWAYPLTRCQSTETSQLFRSCGRFVDLVVIDGNYQLAAFNSKPGDTVSLETGRLEPVTSSPAYPEMTAKCLIAQGISNFTDLAWLSLESGRLAAATLFDDPAMSPKLTNPQTTSDDRLVRIELTAAEAWPLALMAGWLESRLRLPNLVIQKRLEAGRQWRLTFHLAGGKKAVVDFESPQLARLIWPDGRRRELGFSQPSEAAIWAALIDAPAVDPLYAATLEVIANWLT